MATGGKQTVGARVEEDIVDGLKTVQEAEGHTDRSDAVRDVLRTGIREKRGPVSQHWRDFALSAAYQLSLLATVLVVLGFATQMLTPWRATAIAMVMVTIALVPVATVELVRILRGQSEMALFGGEGE